MQDESIHVCKTAYTCQMTQCTHLSGQFTGEAHLVHFELNSYWMVSQAVSRLQKFLYHYGNKWSYNSSAVFRLHTTHMIGIIWK